MAPSADLIFVQHGSAEDVRLAALEQLKILDTPREAAYDDIVQLVREIVQVPIALVSLVHRNRQWFKACLGLAATETSREVSFCAHAIAREDLTEPFVVCDAANDPRFCNNPLVLGPPNIRFYAGMVLLTRGGHPVGSLCAIDTKPRTPTASQLSALKTLSRAISSLLVSREAAEDLRESEERNRLIIDTAKDAVITLDSLGNLMTWNAGTEAMLGTAIEKFKGRGFAETFFDQTSPYSKPNGFVLKLQLSGCAGFIGTEDVSVRRINGEVFPAEMSTACLRTREGDCYSLFIRDTSESVERQALAQDTALREVTIFAMAKLAESRDPETGAHIERVQHYCQVLAEELATEGPYRAECDPEFVRLMYTTSPLHDIGKVGIPDDILLKPGRLSDREFEVMKSHAQIGADTLSAAMERFPNTRFLRMARNIAATHHERFDGSGYPNRLSGADIPVCGRIMAVADVYDALTSRRVYKAAMAHEVARGIIVKESGKHFDPIMVEAFLRCEAKFHSISQRFSEATSEAA